jgi:folate-binding Fe-S cluster repair protein YgfZ
MTSPDDYAALHESAVIGTIAPRAQVAVAGPDRAAFLQGLLTNDTASLTAGTAAMPHGSRRKAACCATSTSSNPET